MLLFNNIKIAFRNTLRNKLFSFINIAGLALGLACCLVIVLFVRQELSYDTYHKNADNIYRLGADAKINETEMKLPSCQAPLGRTLVEEYPVVQNFTRIAKNNSEEIVKIGERTYKLDRTYKAEASFFDFFTVDFLAGDNKALVEPMSIVISRDCAVNFFKSVDNAIDKTVTFNNSDYNVTAVVENSPYNTHLKINALFSSNFDEINPKYAWYMDGVTTYVSLVEGADVKKFEKDIQGVVKKYMYPVFKDVLKGELVAPNYYRYYTMSMKDIHLNSHSVMEFEESGNASDVNTFIIIAIFILLIACINFSNLSTAKASTRAREIGIKKALGSSRRKIMYQFFIESIIISLIAFVFAIVLVELFLPLINQSISSNIIFNRDFQTISIFIGIVIATGLISGLYSAIYLSSFSPIRILKGELTQGKKSAKFRSALVITQFVISIFLIICTLIINKQMSFINNKNIGYNPTNLVKLENTELLKDTELFKQKLKELSGVEAVCRATELPGSFFSGNMLNKYNSDDKTTYSVRMIGCDVDFCTAMNAEIVEGRFFSNNLTNDSLSVVINESAVKALGLSKPIGSEIKFTEDDRIYKVVGVMKNIHTVSLKNKVNSLVIVQDKLWYSDYANMAIRFKDGVNSSTMNQVETLWKEFTGDTPIKYTFFKNILEKTNKKETDNLRIFTGFSILAIFIACIGLLGLISYTIDQRTKEIGIRKINGAPVFSIILYLNKDVIKWIIVSFIIACPFAYYLMDNWLQEFVYKISIDPYIFILSGIFTMLITLATVSWQAFRAASLNPVDCLRDL